MNSWIFFSYMNKRAIDGKAAYRRMLISPGNLWKIIKIKTKQKITYVVSLKFNYFKIVILIKTNYKN